MNLSKDVPTLLEGSYKQYGVRLFRLHWQIDDDSRSSQISLERNTSTPLFVIAVIAAVFAPAVCAGLAYARDVDATTPVEHRGPSQFLHHHYHLAEGDGAGRRLLA